MDDFIGVEKIKTIASTYMAVTGLKSPKSMKLTRKYNGHHFTEYRRNIVIMTNFALQMMTSLDEINRHCFNDFRLRVGKFFLYLDLFQITKFKKGPS